MNIYDWCGSNRLLFGTKLMGKAQLQSTDGLNCQDSEIK